MKTIVVTSQKGGSGKTTLAAHLAVAAELDGETWLIDTDKQGTLSAWHDRRDAETPGRLDVPFHRIAGGLDTIAGQGAAFCFIDTAPTISDQSASLIARADLVVIPVRPSPADLWAVGETVELARAAKRPFIFVLTQAKANAAITAQAAAALSQHGRVAQTFVADRVAYAAAMTGGRTAQEIAARSPAALEVAALWRELNSCFHDKVKAKEKGKTNG